MLFTLHFFLPWPSHPSSIGLFLFFRYNRFILTQ